LINLIGTLSVSPHFRGCKNPTVYVYNLCADLPA
jgi:hypothetical protein